MMQKLSPKERRRQLLSLLSVPVTTALLMASSLATAQEVEIEGVVQARKQSLAGELLLIDIRQPQEWQESGIPDVAIALDMRSPGFLERLQALQEQHPGKRLGFICAVGSRSRYLANWLSQRGIKNLVNVSAGVHGRNGWLANKLPTRKPDPS